MIDILGFFEGLMIANEMPYWFIIGRRKCQVDWTWAYAMDVESLKEVTIRAIIHWIDGTIFLPLLWCIILVDNKPLGFKEADG